MLTPSRLFKILFLLMPAWLAHAEQIQLRDIAYSSQQPTHIAFDLSAACRHRYFTLSHPSRLVIDFENTRLNQAVVNQPAEHPLFLNMRSGVRNGNDLRIVIGLKADANGKSVLVNKANGAELQFDFQSLNMFI